MERKDMENAIEVGVSRGMTRAHERMDDISTKAETNKQDIGVLQNDSEQAKTAQHQHAITLSDVKTKTQIHSLYWKAFWIVVGPAVATCIVLAVRSVWSYYFK